MIEASTPNSKSYFVARQTVAVLGWNLARLGSQLAWVILLARNLGTDGYGGFSGTSGLALTISGFVGLGMGLRMYQDVAREPTIFSIRWSQASLALLFSGTFFTLLFIILGLIFLPKVPKTFIISIALAEVCFYPMVTQVAFAYAAHGLVAKAAATPVIISVFRVLGVLVLMTPLVLKDANLVTYGWLHFLTTAIATFLVLIKCLYELKPNKINAGLCLDDIRQGLGFSSLWASGLALGTLDKALALRVGGAELAGNYTAAFRFSAIVVLPIDAMVTAVMPKLFKDGLKDALNSILVIKLATVSVVYGILGGIFLWNAAGAITWILGAGFESAISSLRILAFYVPVYCLRVLGANILLGFGLKRWRIYCEISSLILLAFLMTAWIPVYGTEGAAKTILVVETSLALLLWLRILSGR